MYYCGIDIAMKSSYIYITDSMGRKKTSGEIPTKAGVLRQRLRPYLRGGLGVAIEADNQTAWIYDLLVDRGDDFDPVEYFGRARSMILEGRIYHVKLQFLPMIARNVAEVQWHSTQTITWNSDGSITAEFRVDGLAEITWWILGYGDQIRVITPISLQNKIRQIAENMIKLNAQ